MPGTFDGLSREQLAEFYSLGDLYIQMAIAEGDCMPASECRACGVPLLATDYAALEDKVREPGGMPINVIRMFWETDNNTGQERAMSDVRDAAEKMYKFFCMPNEQRAKMGADARKIVEKSYGYDRAVSIIEKAILSLDLLDQNETWLNPVAKLAPNSNESPKVKNSIEFVDWCIDNIVGWSDLKRSRFATEMAKSINCGFWVGKGGRESFNTKKAMEVMKSMANKINYWENRRVKLLNNNKNEDVSWLVL